jgi:hypothetical protein
MFWMGHAEGQDAAASFPDVACCRMHVSDVFDGAEFSHFPYMLGRMTCSPEGFYVEGVRDALEGGYAEA